MRNIIRRQATSELVEVSCAVFVRRIDEPARERSQLTIASVVVNIEVENVNESVIDRRILPPRIIAAKESPYVSCAA